MDVNRMEIKNKNHETFGDFQFNYAVVLFGKLSDLQRVKQLLETQQGITIRYQTLDRGKLLIKREAESG
jgi:hypothetical protein